MRLIATPTLVTGSNPRFVLAALTLAIASGASGTFASSFECARIVALGDLHGGIDSLQTMLVGTGITDSHHQWTSSDACLVIVGDMVDRGDRSRELLDYLMSLERQAPGQVHVVLGNHEVMNLVGDLRYVTPGEFAAYADLETKKQRQAGYEIFLRTRAAQELSGSRRKEAFEQSFPAGWFGHRQAFDSDGVYGKWLLSRPVLLVLDSTLFVHGGIEPDDASRAVERLSDEILDEIAEYVRLRKALVEAEWLSPLVSFGAAAAVVDERLSAPDESGESDAPSGASENASRFVELNQAGFVRAGGPLWTRKLALEDEEAYSAEVDRMLRQLGIERIVVGHTTQNDHRIRPRFDDRVFLIDTGAGPAYGGHASALEIEGSRVRAVYPDEVEVLVGQAAPSEEDVAVPRP